MDEQDVFGQTKRLGDSGSGRSGAGEGIRTPDPFLGKEVLYH